jgi:glutaredoxin 3
MEYLDGRKISYEKIDVRGDSARLQQLRDVSGQAKTPTLQWNGDVLADFGVDQLEDFLRDRTAAS